MRAINPIRDFLGALLIWNCCTLSAPQLPLCRQFTFSASKNDNFAATMAEIWLLRIRIMRIVFFAVSGIMQKMHNAPVGIVPLPLHGVCMCVRLTWVGTRCVQWSNNESASNISEPVQAACARMNVSPIYSSLTQWLGLTWHGAPRFLFALRSYHVSTRTSVHNFRFNYCLLYNYLLHK
jgi:hypothetical protein